MGSTNDEETQRKGLSTRESQVLSRLASENRQVISISDIVDVLNIPRKSARYMAYALKEKGWLERIAHRKYLILPLAAGENAVYTEHEFVIASALVEPMYIELERYESPRTDRADVPDGVPCDDRACPGARNPRGYGRVRSLSRNSSAINRPRSGRTR